MESTFEYSVLRLIPDKSRGERINIGIVVFLDDVLDVRCYPDLSKIRALDPCIDREKLRSLGAGLNSLLRNVRGTKARHALLQSFPLVDVSELGWFTCSSAEYDSWVLRLVESLVLTPSSPTRNFPQRLETKVREALCKSKLLGTDPSDIERHLVVEDYPIMAAEGLRADFALRNGRMHFTVVLDLRGSDETLRQVKRGQTAIKAMTLNRARERYSSCARIGIYVTQPRSEEIIEPYLAMLKHDSDFLIDFSDQKDRAIYIDYIHEAARN
jgi:hypothetical protein